MTNAFFQDSEYLFRTFQDVQFTGHKLEHKEFDGCTFIDCNFSEADFYKCAFIECHFVRCNLSVIGIGYSRFSDITFEECKMSGIDWTRANWPNLMPYSPVRFNQCIINDSSFFGLVMPELQLTECTARNVDFREANLRKSDFTYTRFTESLFNNTDLTETDFCEASDYRIDINSNTVKGAKFTRYEALSLLENLGIELVD